MCIHIHEKTHTQVRFVIGVQGGEDSQDALSCLRFFAKEPLIIGLFCGKWPMKIRHPMNLRHPVLWLTGCLIFIGHFPPKSPIISGSVAIKMTCNLRQPMHLRHPALWLIHLFVPQLLLHSYPVCCNLMKCVAVRALRCIGACCSVLQRAVVCCSVFSTLQHPFAQSCHRRYAITVQSVIVCWDAPQCVEVCCSVLPCVAVYPQVLRNNPPPTTTTPNPICLF